MYDCHDHKIGFLEKQNNPNVDKITMGITAKQEVHERLVFVLGYQHGNFSNMDT